MSSSSMANVKGEYGRFAVPLNASRSSCPWLFGFVSPRLNVSRGGGLDLRFEEGRGQVV